MKLVVDFSSYLWYYVKCTKYRYRGKIMTIGEKIKFLRKNIGLTGKQLSQETDIHHVLIRKYETNVNVPKKFHIEKIASVLNINPYVLSKGEFDFTINTVGDFYTLIIELYKSNIISFYQSLQYKEDISIELSENIKDLITIYSHPENKSIKVNINNLSLILNNKLRSLDSYQTFVNLVECYNHQENTTDIEQLELILQQSPELLIDL